MDKRKLGAGGICLATLILLIIAILGYFLFSPAQTSEISDKIEGDSNVIVNTASREVSLFHIENLNNQVSDLKDHVNQHHAIKYGLITVVVVIMVVFMINRCKNIPRKIEEKMEKKNQDEKIENHQDTLIQMGMLKPKRRVKKTQEGEVKKKNKEQEIKKTTKSENPKKKKWIEIEVSEEETTEIA